MTEDKNDSQDTTEKETAVPVEADTEKETAVPVEADTDTQTKGKHVADEPTDEPTEEADETDVAEPGKPRRQIKWSRLLAFGVLPALALVLAMAAGFLKWQDTSVRDREIARIESVQAAKDSTVALLSYKPDTVEQQLGAARDLLTGEFRDSYTSLTNDVVIPGAKQKQISATASVPAAASVSANPGHAVVLVFVNQTVLVGTGTPSATASSVRITMDKIGDRWLISQFDPV